MPQKETEKLRLDKYLWAIRLFKSRSMASDACEKGKVKFKGLPAKPSRHVSINDEYEVKTELKNWKIKVTGLLFSRVQFAESLNYYNDLTPIEEKEKIAYQSSAFYTGKRLSKTGRPSKKQKRDLDDFMSE